MALDSHKGRSPTDDLHASLQQLLLWYASYADGRVALRHDPTHQRHGTDKHGEQSEIVARSDGFQLCIHPAAIPVHVQWCFCGVLADISELLE